MDKNEIMRSFNLRPESLDPKDQPEVTTQILSMDSYYPGEYGGVVFHVECELETDFGRFLAYFTKTSGSSLSFLSAVRKYEIHYFVLNILPLFHPLSKLPNEVSQSSPEESSQL